MAVSSAHGTVHIFKLGGGEKGGSGGGGKGASPRSPPESLDGRESVGEGGYEAFIETKKSRSVG